MRTLATLSAESSAGSDASAVATSKAFFIWLVPLLYPLWYPAIFRSAEWAREGAMLGWPLLAVSLAAALAGPLAAWLTLNYLDQNGLDRRQYRVAVYGALFTALNPPLYNFIGNRLADFHQASLRVPVWYFVSVAVAAAALLPAPEPASTTAIVTFRRIHRTSAMLIVTFAAAHVFNHVLAIISLQTHTAVLHVLRMVYRQRLVEAALVAAVATQVCTGFIMVWRSHLRPATAIRNLQMVSGLYLVMFFVTHLHAAFTARQRLDTTFGWATNAPAGLLAKASSVGLLPYYILAVVVVSVHLGCQARWNLVSLMSETAARKVSYGLMAVGGMAAFTIALAACGIHLFG
jgi:hypothetical protein